MADDLPCKNSCIMNRMIPADIDLNMVHHTNIFDTTL